MSTPRIVVVGSINADLVVRMPRLPVRGETVTSGATTWLPGGKGANQALAAARAGAQVTMVGAVGADAAGAVALSGLRAAGVNLHATAELEDVPTSVALVLVEESGENQIVVADGANAHVQVPASVVAHADLVICQLEVPDDVLLAACRAATGPVVLNAAPARPIPAEVLQRADVLIVNESEFAQLGCPTDGIVVLTLGARGAELRADGELVAKVAAPQVAVVDTVGAGDTFVGFFATALAQGLSHTAALETAVWAGALAVTAVGAQTGIPTAAAVAKARG